MALDPNRRNTSDSHRSEPHSTPSPLSALLRTSVLIAAALLACTRLRLFDLPDIAAIGAVRRLVDLAHVVAILDHELTAEAILVVSNLCHDKLLINSTAPALANVKRPETLSVRYQCVRWISMTGSLPHPPKSVQ